MRYLTQTSIPRPFFFSFSPLEAVTTSRIPGFGFLSRLEFPPPPFPTGPGFNFFASGANVADSCLFFPLSFLRGLVVDYAIFNPCLAYARNLGGDGSFYFFFLIRKSPAHRLPFDSLELRPYRVVRELVERLCPLFPSLPPSLLFFCFDNPSIFFSCCFWSRCIGALNQVLTRI